jgi:hypothetical protein
MRKSVQRAASEILLYGGRTGDEDTVCELAQELVDNLGNGVNSRGLVEYFVKLGGLIVSETDKKFIGWHSKPDVDDATLIRETMWYDFKPVNPWAGFDLFANIGKTVKAAARAEKHVTEAPEDADKVKTDANTVRMLDLLATRGSVEQAIEAYLSPRDNEPVEELEEEEDVVPAVAAIQ